MLLSKNFELVHVLRTKFPRCCFNRFSWIEYSIAIVATIVQYVVTTKSRKAMHGGKMGSNRRKVIRSIIAEWAVEFDGVIGVNLMSVACYYDRFFFRCLFMLSFDMENALFPFFKSFWANGTFELVAEKDHVNEPLHFQFHSRKFATCLHQRRMIFPGMKLQSVYRCKCPIALDAVRFWC